LQNTQVWYVHRVYCTHTQHSAQYMDGVFQNVWYASSCWRGDPWSAQIPAWRDPRHSSTAAMPWTRLLPCLSPLGNPALMSPPNLVHKTDPMSPKRTAGTLKPSSASALCNVQSDRHHREKRSGSSCQSWLDLQPRPSKAMMGALESWCCLARKG
jgi:hypothetical protein